MIFDSHQKKSQNLTLESQKYRFLDVLILQFRFDGFGERKKRMIEKRRRKDMIERCQER